MCVCVCVCVCLCVCICVCVCVCSCMCTIGDDVLNFHVLIHTVHTYDFVCSRQLVPLLVRGGADALATFYACVVAASDGHPGHVTLARKMRFECTYVVYSVFFM